MGFIETFMEAAKDSESPRSYWFWSSLCALSGVAKRNVWIQRPTWRTYPNIFVFLVGESGLRKGPPVNLAKEVVQSVNNTRIISGRSSLQGIISHLGTAYTTPDGKVVDKAYGYISASEFSSSIVRDPDALTILTDLYDSCYHDKWVDMLRGGRVELVEPSITLLAGINPPHFEDFISPTAISGGFVGRVLLVFESEKATINPAVRKTAFSFDLDKVRDKCITSLKKVAEIKGEMVMDEETIQRYENWYHEFERYRKEKQVKDKTGSINRVGENILKTSILFSLSRSADNQIILEDMENAMKVCLQSLSSVAKTTVGQGKSLFAPQTKFVLTELIAAPNHEITRKQFLKNYGTIDAPDLDRVIDTLVQAGAVEQINRGPEIVYRLTKTMLKEI